MRQHQAQGLHRMFRAHATHLVSVLAAPSAPASNAFTLALAAELSRQGWRVWLVEREPGAISQALGCRPLLPWRASLPLVQQVILAGDYGLIHAPGGMAGDATLAAAARESRGCDFLLFDGGRFSQEEAPLDPRMAQSVIVLLGVHDAEAGYALVKALQAARSPARLVLMGDAAESISRTHAHFTKRPMDGSPTAGIVCQIGNTRPETSSDTLTIAPNLTSVVSRIMQNDQPKVAHGGSGKGAEEVYER